MLAHLKTYTTLPDLNKAEEYLENGPHQNRYRKNLTKTYEKAHKKRKKMRGEKQGAKKKARKKGSMLERDGSRTGTLDCEAGTRGGRTGHEGGDGDEVDTQFSKSCPAGHTTCFGCFVF